MIEIAVFVILAGLLIVFAHIFAWISSFVALPDALLLMLLGILIGPILGIVTPDFFGDFGAVILTIALVIMLFDGGAAIHVSSLRKTMGGVMRLTVISFVLATAGVAVLLSMTTDFPLIISLMVGAIVGDTTSVVVITLAKRLEITEDVETTLVLESIFSDVLQVMVVLALLKAYQGGNLDPISITQSAFLSTGLAIIAGVAVGFAWGHLLNWIRNLRNSMFITLAMAFIVYGAMEILEFSGLIAVLVFGMTMGSAGILNHYLSSSHRLVAMFIHPLSLSRRERSFFAELVFLLQTFFFVYIGISMQFTNWAAARLALLTTAALLGLRLIAVHLSVSRTVGVREASLMAVMIPKGITSVALVLLLVQAGIPEADFIEDFVVATILWTIVCTSICIFLLEKTPLRLVYERLLANFGKEQPH